MNSVEQAIFTSSESDREAGYQVVASSAGVHVEDARELAAWAPAHDSLFDLGPDAESLNFHPLPSGAYCLSRSTPAGWEHSGGQRIYTHCLIVPPEVLARFANNPFALARAMSDHGLWHASGAPGPMLEAFSPPGGAAPVDQVLLHDLAVDPGPEALAAVVQAVRDAVCLAVTDTGQPATLMAGLFSCLPQECRLEFSFTTGLKFSPRRSFRVVALSDDPAERLWLANYPNVTVLDLGEPAAWRSTPIDSWARLIERALAAGQIPFLAAQISKRRFDLSLDDLPALGLQLLEGLDSSESRCDDAVPTPSERPMAHAAHRQFEKSRQAATATVPSASAQLSLHSPKVLDQLEHLDDLVYEAISGESGSLEKLRSAWPMLLGELDDEMLAESREQYLRYALSIWEECVDAGSIRNPARAIQALDVLCLLFGESR